MDDSSLKFLENLCNACGPTGFEREPALVARRRVEKYCDEVSGDKLGSLLFRKTGARRKPVVLLPGHSDEIGFIVSGVSKEGFLHFNPLGGWPDQVLLAQRVAVMTRKGRVSGVIAAKPPHLMTEEERKQLVPLRKMFIDIGCSNPDEVREMGVRVGDAVVPESRFSTFVKPVFKDGKKTGEATLAMGRAFDNRAGLFVAVEAVRRLALKKIPHPNTVVAAATTQEEVGVRGATTTGYKVDPDVCIVLDVDIAGDVPGIAEHEAAARLGAGVSICTFDRSLIPNQALKELVISVAEKEKVPYVLTSMWGGGTDGGAIHKTREGCPTIYLGIATRHIHSHVGILDLADLERCVDLLIAVVRRLDGKTVASLTEIH
ncbi:M42 family metallopeptidase [Candidatus Sumerlaeota bacterium]|nr:M42 family metallopeptidase [Candidatus Sumerlaeota bacterium]